ncbi:hypothetical protein JHK87_056857 [Glycine soja]|nr:hypothetical protein JHK87_056857 [Glycine soja]
MGLVSSFLGILGFAVGIPLGLFVGFFLFVYSETKHVKDPVVRPISELGPNALQELLPEIPLWVKTPDYERVDWLNKFLLDTWPFLDTAICKIIRSRAQPIFSEYIGKYQIKAIEFDKLSLGTLPPTVCGIKVLETNGKELVMEQVIKWAGNPEIVLSVYVASLKITVQETIKKQVANLYLWPQTLEIPILDESSVAIKKPVGILHVNVVRAQKLLKMDLLGTSDPYVKLSLTGDKLPAKKTTVKRKNLNPEWNEKFKLVVKDPQSQVLQLQVYDWDKVGGHDKLGMQLVPLKVLKAYENKEFTLDLLKDTNLNETPSKKPRGKIVVDLTFVPFKEDSSKFGGPSEGYSRKESGIDIVSDDEVQEGAGLLSIVIQEAEEVEGDHHNNPFAVLTFRGEKKRTKMMKKTRHPRWNEEFQFMLEEPPQHEKIHIEVMSKRKNFSFLPKKSLGHVEINLRDVVHNGHINDKYHLINSRNGVMHVEIRWKVV